MDRFRRQGHVSARRGSRPALQRHEARSVRGPPRGSRRGREEVRRPPRARDRRTRPDGRHLRQRPRRSRGRAEAGHGTHHHVGFARRSARPRGGDQAEEAQGESADLRRSGPTQPRPRDHRRRCARAAGGPRPRRAFGGRSARPLPGARVPGPTRRAGTRGSWARGDALPPGGRTREAREVGEGPGQPEGDERIRPRHRDHRPRSDAGGPGRPLVRLGGGGGVLRSLQPHAADVRRWNEARSDLGAALRPGDRSGHGRGARPPPRRARRPGDPQDRPEHQVRPARARAARRRGPGRRLRHDGRRLGASIRAAAPTTSTRWRCVGSGSGRCRHRT